MEDGTAFLFGVTSPLTITVRIGGFSETGQSPKTTPGVEGLFPLNMPVNKIQSDPGPGVGRFLKIPDLFVRFCTFWV